MQPADLEDEIQTRILAGLPSTGLGSNIVVQACPQNQSEFSRPTDFERVTVCYDSSEFDPEITADVMTQPETVKVVLTLQAFSLRGDANGLGIYGMKSLLKNILLGWTPEDCDMPMKSKYFGPPNNDPAFFDNMWCYEYHFITRTIEVQEYVTPIPNVTANFTSVSTAVTVASPLITLNPQ